MKLKGLRNGSKIWLVFNKGDGEGVTRSKRRLSDVDKKSELKKSREWWTPEHLESKEMSSI